MVTVATALNMAKKVKVSASANKACSYREDEED